MLTGSVPPPMPVNTVLYVSMTHAAASFANDFRNKAVILLFIQLPYWKAAVPVIVLEYV